jgi:hypothetical protein
MASTSTLVSTCEQAFEEVGEKHHLATENKNAFILDCIMWAIDAVLHLQE